MEFRSRFYWLLLFLCISLSYQIGTDIIAMNKLLEAHFATNNSISIDEWNSALPTTDEIYEMNLLIKFVLSLSNFSGLNSNIMRVQFMRMFFPNLAEWVTISTMNDHYCIIHEHLPRFKTAFFPRFWGYVAITSRNWVKRHYLHHSAPHFQSDGEVCAQAAAIFQYTRSRSLTVAGANRFAVQGQKMSSCQKSSFAADAAHNNETMFHAINAAIRDALRRERKLVKRKSPADVFIQWHGMAETSCPMSDIFVSTGSRGNNPIYSLISSTPNQIVSTVNKLKGRKVAHTPRTDRRCPLLARTNTFGRLVNSVPARNVCWRNALDQDITGQFIHIEQKQSSRNNWILWEDTMKTIFPPYTFSQSS